MGAGGSIDSFTDATTSDLTGADVATPRGISAKTEVVRLRTVLMNQGLATMQFMARARFEELDVDKSGYLENEELFKVAEWVMHYFGDKLGADPSKVKNKLMSQLDANKDGKLDIREFEDLFKTIVKRMSVIERAKSKFMEMDTDASGFLEKSEIDTVIDWTLQAFPEDDSRDKYKAKLLKDVDRNGDGKLDMAEFIELFEEMLVRIDLIKRAQAKFNELDTDKSGVLEKAELENVADWVLEAYAEKSMEDRATFKSSLMKRIDVNQDGRLSIQEFAVVFDEITARMDIVERAKKQFKLLDSDNSGFLEKNELGDFLRKWAATCGQELNIDPSDSLDALLMKVDANSDGKLSLEEFIPLFDQMVAKSGIWG